MMGFDSGQFRQAMGRFATGVTVVTAAPEGHGPFGQTVNSFTALSLDPPLVLWCLDKGSKLGPAWAAAESFAVNILSDAQAALSRRYATPGGHSIPAEGYDRGRFGVPCLNGCLSSLECQIERRIDAGDHIIMIGRVLHIEVGQAEAPLIFYGAAYRELNEASDV